MTIGQKKLLARVASEKGWSQTGSLREAFHVYLKERGSDDGLLFDRKEVIAQKWLKEWRVK